MIMKFHPINKQIAINASALQVWKVLTDDADVRQWYKPFSQGAYAITDWEEGSKVTFTDASGGGMVGRIAKNQPGKLLDIELLGMYNNNSEDYDSPEAKMLAGSHEVYELNEQDGLTTLAISTAMYEEYYVIMSAAWDKALLIIKQLAEKN